MKALRLQSVGRLSLDDVPIPVPSSHQLRLNVSYCALCRTDAKMWQKGHRDLSLPRVLGHEIAGTDEASGTRFVVWPGLSCGKCRFCSEGLENLCPTMRIIGFNQDGGLAERMIAPNDALIPVPEGIPLHLACMAEPLACCINALQQIELQRERRILIFGAGPVGLMMALTAFHFSAEPFIVEKQTDRFEQTEVYLKRLGIEYGNRAPDNEFDAAVNACSSTQAFSEGLRSIRAAGSFCFFSGLPHDGDLTINILNEIHYRQLRISGAYGCTRLQMIQALEIIGRHQQEIELLVEHQVSLDQAAKWFARIAEGKSLKIIVKL